MRIFNSKFIGRQLTRFRLGQTYLLMITSIISTIALVRLAFNMSLWWVIFLGIGIVISTFVMGYYFDKKDIRTYDNLKSIEIAHRYMTIADMKRFEFEKIMYLAVIKAIQNKEIDPISALEREYREFIKRWTPNPKEKKEKV